MGGTGIRDSVTIEALAEQVGGRAVGDTDRAEVVRHPFLCEDLAGGVGGTRAVG
jgi:hypothetical protein